MTNLIGIILALWLGLAIAQYPQEGGQNAEGVWISDPSNSDPGQPPQNQDGPPPQNQDGPPPPNQDGPPPQNQDGPPPPDQQQSPQGNKV
jgi:hypothetical protein